MLQLEQKAMPPLIEQHVRRLHAKVQVSQHQGSQALALASQQLAQELPELQQLHERLAVFALVALVALVAPEQREPVLKQLVQQVPLVLVQLVPQNFSPNQY
jgi:hypothetical protein